MATKRYTVKQEIRIENSRPNPRWNGEGTVGGDLADFHYSGWEQDGDDAVFIDPEITTTLDLNEDEVIDIATEVVQFAYESIQEDIFH